MTMLITYPDGTTELLPKAVRVDQTNYHEGMYDFYDESGMMLLRQIDMSSGIKWELVAESQAAADETPLFLRGGSEGRKGNAQDEKDGSSE